MTVTAGYARPGLQAGAEEARVPATLQALYAKFHDTLLIAVAVAGLAGDAGLWWAGLPYGASLAWMAATAPVLLSLLAQIVVSLRRGDVGLDVVAALSMAAALVFGQPLAGNVVALMYAGGQVLEDFAQGRARKEMTALLGRVARTAMRFRGQTLEEVSIEAIRPGDRLLIREGEVVPVDGRVGKDGAVLNLAALTGESLPKQVQAGGDVPSGATSAGSPFELTATRPAADSTYAGIVRLVEAAQASKAPMVRLADRYGIWFLALTVAIAAAAWALAEDPIRALSVLVVATPCPLILAVPVAIISGMSRISRIGVLVKGGGMLETLARVRTVILDKTGTLTLGQPAVTEVRTASGFTEADVLTYGASLDQASGHVVAQALIKEAGTRGLKLSAPSHVAETLGQGIEGTVDGRRIAVSGQAFVRARVTGDGVAGLLAGLPPATMTAVVGVDGGLGGLIVLQDQVRPDAKAMLAALRASGVARIVLASGDRREIAEAAGKQVGADLVLGDLDPQGKVAAVRHESVHGPVMMVGDGVNDAPALAAADVGVAMGARGTASSSEAAGIVILVDELGPLAKAIVIARRTRMIALQSVGAGLGLSMIAMVAAAFGYLPPVQGALLQEVIDVAVILNALRALR